MQFGNDAFDIFGRTAAAQKEFGAVALGHPLHIIDQARGLADANDEDSCGQRVERSRVTRFGRPNEPLDLIDNPAGSAPRGLVDVQKAKAMQHMCSI